LLPIWRDVLSRPDFGLPRSKASLETGRTFSIKGTSNNQGAIMRTRVGELFTDDL